MTHDDVVEVSPAPPRRRGRWPAVAFVLVLALAVGGLVTWLATRSGDPVGVVHAGGRAAGAACPPSLTPGVVPAAPTAAGVGDRLVPDRDPTSVVLCEYDAATVVAPAGPAGSAGPAALPLGRSGELAGSSDLVTALRSAPPEAVGGRSCPGDPAPSVTTGLVWLGYDDGGVWVTSPGTCSGSTNGVATSSLELAPLVSAALDIGAGTADAPASVTPAPPDPGVGSAPFPGEPADPGYPSGVAPVDPDPFAACESAGPADPDDLVPFTPVAVRVCHAAVDPSVAAVTVVDRPALVAAGLLTALAKLPVLEPDVACAAIGGEQWGLRFSADDGRTAFVVVDAGGCATASNGVRTVKADAALFDAVSAAD